MRKVEAIDEKIVGGNGEGINSALHRQKGGIPNVELVNEEMIDNPHSVEDRGI